MDISDSSIAQLFQRLTDLLPEKWQRKRGSLGPVQVLFSIMHMAASARTNYHETLDYLKRTIGEQLEWECEPCASSLSEARRKLSKDECLLAFRESKKFCAGLKNTPKVTYKDYRITAIDMTKLALPAYKSIVSEFGCPKDRKGNDAPAPQGTLTAIWDVSTNTPIDWRLEKVYASERFASYDLVTCLGSSDLLITDRGYPSRRFLKQLSDQGTAYLIRMPGGKTGGFTEVREFKNDTSAWDREIWLRETNKRSDERTIRVRLMKRRLDNGEIAVFATNLYGSRTHHRRALCDLYCYRWDIETSFKEMKIWHGLENFNARYAEGIHQEVAGLMLFMLLTGEMEAQARGYHQVDLVETSTGDIKEPEYRFNRKIIASTVAYLLVAAAEGPDAIKAEFEYCMKRLWRYRQKRKPGRKFPRAAKDPNSKYKKSTYNANKNTKKKGS